MAETPMDQQITHAIKLGIASTQKGDHENALKIFIAIYANPAIKSPPPDGMSFFGLSLAIAEKQTGKGIQLCRDAISAQFFSEKHYENLIRIHLHKNNRLLAEQTLVEGLRNVPTGSRLVALRKEMGLEPVAETPKHDRAGRFAVRSLPTGMIILAGVLFFALTFGVTFFVVYRQLYGP